MSASISISQLVKALGLNGNKSNHSNISKLGLDFESLLNTKIKGSPKGIEEVEANLPNSDAKISDELLSLISGKLEATDENQIGSLKGETKISDELLSLISLLNQIPIKKQIENIGSDKKLLEIVKSLKDEDTSSKNSDILKSISILLRALDSKFAADDKNLNQIENLDLKTNSSNDQLNEIKDLLKSMTQEVKKQEIQNNLQPLTKTDPELTKEIKSIINEIKEKLAPIQNQKSDENGNMPLLNVSKQITKSSSDNENSNKLLKGDVSEETSSKVGELDVKPIQIKTTTDSGNKSSDVINTNSSKDELFLKKVAGNETANSNEFSHIFLKTASAPANVEESQVITRQNLSEDIIKSIKYMQSNDLKDLTVKVVPRELGEVVIKLTVENGVMKANITAANKEAFNLINSNATEISNKLQNNMMSIHSFSVSVFNGDTAFMQQNGGKGQENQRHKKFVSSEKEDEEFASQSYNLDDNSVNALA